MFNDWPPPHFHRQVLGALCTHLLLHCWPNFSSHYLATELFLHALRTPLTTTRLNLELAVHSSDHSQPQYVQTALQSTHHACRLFESLPPINLPSADQFSLLSALYAVKQQQVLNHPGLQFWLPTRGLDTVTIRGCQWYFVEMMMCLINNAFQAYGYTSGLSTVVVQCRQSGRWVELAVIDGGRGMNWLTQLVACQPGFSLHESPSSHQGFGLAMSKLLMTKHFRGRLRVVSKPGRGTTILLTLPLATGTQTPDA